MQDLASQPQLAPIHFRIGSLDNPRRFKDQDFESLRTYHWRRGQKFIDDTFPADISVIGPELEDELCIQNLEWWRPGDLCKEPHLIVGGVSLFDIQQSHLGDCWVLSTMGAMTLKQRFLRNIIPLNQGYTVQYAGIFHFRFWHFGEWVDVVIDDQLPFLNGKYLSVQPSSSNEFWPCLLEKAYAKLQGSYQNLHWGDPSEAFVNFSGGVTVAFQLKDPRRHTFDLFKIASMATQNALMGATSEKMTTDDWSKSCGPVRQEHTNSELENGLVEAHAYTVTGTAQVHYESTLVDLIRLWNPWCRTEWKGEWSDCCKKWDKVTPDERKKLLEKKNNGEFWMAWEHFKQEFYKLFICNFTPDFLDLENERKTWYKNIFFNCWSKQSTATNKDTLWKNPQYLIRVTENDEVKSGYNMVVSLMQNPDRPRFITAWTPIGFKLWKTDQKVLQHDKMPQEFFSQNPTMVLHFHEKRELTKLFQLPAGTYVIVPFTIQIEKDLSFMLRIFLKSKNCAEELGIKQTDLMPLKPEENYAEQIFAQYADQCPTINAWQLQNVLNEVIIKDDPACLRRGGFSVDASRAILAAMDYTMDGRLNMKEFGKLWIYLHFFKAIFRKNDVNGSGLLDKSAFQYTVNSTGHSLSNELLNVMFTRYGDPSMRMNLTDFLCCMIRLKTTSKTFRFIPNDGKGVYLNQEKWLQHMMHS